LANVVEALVPGGKASAGPPLGPALGPLGVNVAQVVAKINEQTKDSMECRSLSRSRSSPEQSSK